MLNVISHQHRSLCDISSGSEDEVSGEGRGLSSSLVEVCFGIAILGMVNA